jgi:hypothetical protein
MMPAFFIAILLLIANLTGFVLFYYDKHAAQDRLWRVSENPCSKSSGWLADRRTLLVMNGVFCPKASSTGTTFTSVPFPSRRSREVRFIPESQSYAFNPHQPQNLAACAFVLVLYHAAPGCSRGLMDVHESRLKQNIARIRRDIRKASREMQALIDADLDCTGAARVLMHLQNDLRLYLDKQDAVASRYSPS